MSPAAHKFGLTIGDVRLDNQMKTAQLPAVMIRSSYVTRQRTILQDEVVAREQKKLHFLQVCVFRVR